MGKPAARMGDTSAHGGTIVLGNPTLLIGKMPASTLGDMHVCPMCTGPVPHVGGPITLGSMGVLLGKKPGARISDMSVCVGPPSMPVVGCFTVLIGEAGSGSQAGSAAAAAAAAALSKKGPKAVDPFPLAEPPGPTEAHEILIEFTDTAGKPISGVKYTLTDPDKAELMGASTQEGAARHAGYAKKGSFELFVPELKNAKWKKAKLKMGEEAEFEVEADLAEAVKEAKVVLFENRGNERRAVAFLDLPVEGKKVKGKWKPEYAEVEIPPLESAESDAAAPPPPPPEKPTYDFLCVADGLVAVSDTLTLADMLEIELLDADGKGIADAEYEIILPGGEIRRGKLDGSGKAKFEDLEPGGAEVRFPGQLGSGAPENEIVMDEVVITASPNPEAEAEGSPETTDSGSTAGSGSQGGSQSATAAETGNQTETKKSIKVGERGPIAEELNIRLAGFGGCLPNSEFDAATEKCVKQFQSDWMKMASPSGMVDSATAKALDEFSKKHTFDFAALKCDCGKCGGFGKGQFKGEYNRTPHAESGHKYEYPGIHRSLIWALKASLFHMEAANLALGSISCGYRCWINNQNHKRNTTNHMGKAVDFTVDSKAAGVAKKGGKPECDRARTTLVSKLGGQIRWASKNKFSMEPGDKSSPNEFVSPTWVHLDVREFDPKYLSDKFFSKTLENAIGESMQELFAQWEGKQ